MVLLMLTAMMMLVVSMTTVATLVYTGLRRRSRSDHGARYHDDNNHGAANDPDVLCLLADARS